MRINYIYIERGEQKRKVEFNEYINLIYSKENSKGKTTLLRAILYGLGYNIPATDGIKTFDNFYIEIMLENNNKEYIVERHGDIIKLHVEEETISYILPEQIIELHSILFGIEDELILNNLLAIFYIDQEKGWTLLNRGIIIGKNRFNIEDFIATLSEKDVMNINNEIKKLADEIKKYNYLKSISEYKNDIIAEEKISYTKKGEEELYSKKKFLLLKKEELIADIKELTQILKENKKLIEYIEKLDIYVKVSEDENIKVDKNNILNFGDNQIFYQTRKKELEIQLGKIKNEINNIDIEINNRNLLFNVKTVAEEVDEMLQDIKIDEIQIEKIMKQLKRRKERLTKEMHEILSYDNKYLMSIYETIKKYSKELEIDKYIKDDPGFVLTHHLKGKTGRILTQMSFVFKIAYVLEIKKKYNLNLPLIIDSPRTSELTDKSATAMMKILERDFKENQIIFASVYDFDEISKNIIELKDNLFY